MASSSIPSARADVTHLCRPRARRAWVPGGGPSGRRATKVPTPCRPSTRPCVLELAVGLLDRVGVDGELRHDVLDGRQPVAHVEHTQAHRLADLLGDLQIGRHAGVGPQVEADRLVQYFTSHLGNYRGSQPGVNGNEECSGLSPRRPGSPRCPSARWSA